MRRGRAIGGLRPAIDALDTLVELGPGRIDDVHVTQARALRAQIDERLALGDGWTVVALVGGTGVGKSALVNRLAGAQVAGEGVRRPTTERPLAVVSSTDDEGLPALLAWLGIDHHAAVPPGGDPGLPPGLVLLDLPDHDSVAESHRAIAARLAQRVDGLFVVVDPVKYARADLHRGPLAPLTDHAEVVTVVLNRADELGETDVERCRRDLEAHLERGRPATSDPVDVLVTSAATGEGVEALRGQLEVLVARRGTMHRRLAGDVASLARRVEGELEALPDPVPDREHLLATLLDVTDAHRVVGEAAVAYRRDARTAMRSPLARLARLPLRGVASVGRAFGVGERPPAPAAPPTSVPRIAAALADELQLRATTGATHAVLAATIDRLASTGAPALADAVDGVGVRPEPRRWWVSLAALRGVTEAVALAGFVWLVLLGVAEWLQLPEIPTPHLVGALTWPTGLLLGGSAVRILLGLVSRWASARGARRHRARTAAAVRRRLDAVAHDRLLAPYEQERDRHVRLRDTVGAVLSPRRR